MNVKNKEYTLLDSVLVPLVVVTPLFTDENCVKDFTVEYVNKSCKNISCGDFAVNTKCSDYLQNTTKNISAFISMFYKLSDDESVIVSIYISPSKSKYLVKANKFQDNLCMLTFFEMVAKVNPVDGFLSSRYHTPNLRQSLISEKLSTAIMGKNFHLFFQPQYSISDNRLRGFEALIRWTDSDLGIVSPESFIPIAEKSNFIIRLGWWILETAISVLRFWQKEYGFDGILSVNVSPVQLKEKNFITIFLSLLKIYQIDPGTLEIEITENILIDDMQHTVSIFQEMKKNHVLVSIDDFGTGYCSLKYLQLLPVNTLKLDKSLIDGITSEDKISANIAITIINLAHKLGLETIAEGVEDESQLKILHSMNCKTVQGYLRGRPMNRSHCETLLKKYA